MTRTTCSAALIAAALALAPAAAAAQGLTLEVRPSGPPAWLDPPNVVSPNSTESWGQTVVQQQMVLGTEPAFVGQDRFGHWMLPRTREMGELPPFVEFED